MDFLYLLQQFQHPILTMFFETISLLVDQTLLIAIVCYLYWCYDKKLATKVAVGYFTSGLAVQSLKVICRIPRPWILDSRIKPSEEMLETATGYSFPSGHTQTATSTCYSLLEHFKKSKWKYVLLVFPILMMFSRMYVRVHSPLDVSVSFIISAVIVFSSMYLLNKDYNRYLKIISYILMSCSIISFIYTYFLVTNGTSEYVLVEDCIKMCGACLGFGIGLFLEMKYLHFEIKERTLLQKVILIVVGLIGAIAFKSGLSLILPENMFSDCFRYCMTIVWIIYLYPLCFVKMNK